MDSPSPSAPIFRVTFGGQSVAYRRTADIPAIWREAIEKAFPRSLGRGGEDLPLQEISRAALARMERGDSMKESVVGALRESLPENLRDTYAQTAATLNHLSDITGHRLRAVIEELASGAIRIEIEAPISSGEPPAPDEEPDAPLGRQIAMPPPALSSPPRSPQSPAPPPAQQPGSSRAPRLRAAAAPGPAAPPPHAPARPTEPEPEPTPAPASSAASAPAATPAARGSAHTAPRPAPPPLRSQGIAAGIYPNTFDPEEDPDLWRRRAIARGIVMILSLALLAAIPAAVLLLS